eukprot:TRINITY_DN2445_c0_g2_i4.p1 TRINITY_DN2445_c0_g2~~TRINITY_DN2445_c0_g2_i4.p1  ORF type:complete len:482 (-),score=183.66 TRINITY_DN2445_c0_g2_i4:80-1525(-)
MRSALSLAAALCWCTLLRLGAAGPSSGAIDSGDKALRSGQFDAAIRHYSLACDLEPSSYLPFLKRSSVLTVLGQKRGALRDLDQVLRINPGYVNAISKRLKLRLECCELDGVQQDIQQATQLGGAALPITLQQLHALKSSYAQAKALAAREHDPVGAARASLGLLQGMTQAGHCTDSEEAALLTVKLLLRTGEHEQAVVEGGKLIKLNRQSIAGLGLRAEAFYQLGDVEMSVKHLREGLKQDPEHKQCKTLHKKVRNLQRRMNNADADLEAGNYEDAATGYKGALKADPAHRLFAHDLNVKLCRAQVKAKQGEAALEACGAALQVDAASVDALLLRGEGKALLEDFQGSLNDYKQAKEHRADDRAIDEKIQQAQRLLEQSKRKNYYKILGIKRSASKADIKKVYRKLALKFHPDKVKEEDKAMAEHKFRDIAEAYGVLNDDELRPKYDNGEDVSGQAQQQQQQHHGFPGGFGGGNFHFHFR